jgi:hypothetical protein
MMNYIDNITSKVSLKKIFFFLLIVSPILYVGSCEVLSERNAGAFDQIKVGMTRNMVKARFGMPSHVERPGALFVRYATSGCQNPCVERLWFENRFILGIEAWSVALDKNDRVIDKAYWSSP